MSNGNKVLLFYFGFFFFFFFFFVKETTVLTSLWESKLCAVDTNK